MEIKQMESRRRLIVVGCSLTVGIIAAASLVIASQRASEITAFEIATSNLANGMAQQTGAWFGAIDLALNDVRGELLRQSQAKSDPFAAMLRGGRVTLFLRDRQKYLSGINSLAIVDAQGALANSSQAPMPAGETMVDRDFFRHFQSGDDLGLFVGAPAKQADGEWTAVLARRITDQQGVFQGIIIAELSLSRLEQFFKLAMPVKRELTVYRSDGTVLVHYPHAEAEIGWKVPDRAPWRAVMKTGGGAYAALSPFDGIPVVAVARPLPDTPIVVEASVTQDLALAEWRRSIPWVVLGSVVSVIAVILLLRFLGFQYRRLEDSERMLGEKNSALEALAVDLRRAQLVADEATRSKSMFLAGMAHELRTPLNAVLGFSDMILNEIYGPVEPARYRSYASYISESGRHLLSLINDLLDLSKIEAGKLELEVQILSCSDLGDYATRLTVGMAAEHQVSVSVSVAEDCAILHADERAARQILLNLMSNAIKFTPAGGKVTLRFARSGTEGAVIEVTDTGVGMSPEEIMVALLPYGQIESNRELRTPGTGLGLPLVTALAGEHGGRVAVASERGSGTKVTVFLPWHAHIDAGASARNLERV
jgi:two-component system, cell cycle sensor histidine kinase PleC